MNDIIVIKPKKGLSFIDIKELLRYRELLVNLVIRDLKVRYKQSLIGGTWAILQPFLTMVIFSIFFGQVAKIQTQGIPYPIFSYSGLLLWTYFTGALTNASNSMVSNANLLTKIYFPRILIPISATLSGIIDYVIAFGVLVGMMIYYKYYPGFSIILLPIILFLTWLTATGIGFWLSAINVKYRDVRYALPFFIQLLLFMTPVIYPIALAGRYKILLLMNPMSGIIEAHRVVLLGQNNLNLAALGLSSIVSIIIFISGLYYFKSVEKHFADIV
jgi:lipopolysaccharide transport system permease protein